MTNYVIPSKYSITFLWFYWRIILLPFRQINNKQCFLYVGREFYVFFPALFITTKSAFRLELTSTLYEPKCILIFYRIRKRYQERGSLLRPESPGWIHKQWMVAVATAWHDLQSLETRNIRRSCLSRYRFFSSRNQYP